MSEAEVSPGYESTIKLPDSPPADILSLLESTPAVGRYVLAGRLGAGGMGVVYRAHDPVLKRTVALKFPLEHGDELFKEASMAARLDHPHIAKVFEIGEKERIPFIAMQYIDGKDLKKSGPTLTLPRKVEVVLQAAEAIRYAHANGVIHRDIKPLNIMMDRSGHIFVMDFGLARVVAGPEAVAGGNQLVGSPSYMPPEQVEGKADAQSDVYALGATLYDLLTGTSPFTGGTLQEVLKKAADLTLEPTYPRKLDPSIPPDLEAIVLHALKKRRTERYADVGQLIHDLTRFRTGEPLRYARPVTWAYVLKAKIRRQPVLWTLSAALLVSLAGGAGFGVHGLDRARVEAESRATVESNARAETDRNLKATRRALADTWARRGHEASEERDEAAALLYFGIASDLDPEARFATPYELSRRNQMPLLSVIPEVKKPDQLVFNRSGRRLAVLRPNERTQLWDADKGEPMEDRKEIEGLPEIGVFSADGARLLRARDGTSLEWIDAATGRSLLTFAHGSPLAGASLSRDGKTLLTWDAENTLRVWDAERATPPRPLPPVVGPRSWQLGRSTLLLEFSKDGVTFRSLDSSFEPWTLHAVEDVQVLQSDHRLLVKTSEQTWQLVDPWTRRIVEITPSWSWRVTIDADGSRLATTNSLDDEGQVWDVEGMKIAYTLGKGAVKVVFYPKGRSLTLYYEGHGILRGFKGNAGAPIPLASAILEVQAPTDTPYLAIRDDVGGDHLLWLDPEDPGGNYLYQIAERNRKDRPSVDFGGLRTMKTGPASLLTLLEERSERESTFIQAPYQGPVARLRLSKRPIESPDGRRVLSIGGWSASLYDLAAPFEGAAPAPPPERKPRAVVRNVDPGVEIRDAVTGALLGDRIPHRGCEYEDNHLVNPEATWLVCHGKSGVEAWKLPFSPGSVLSSFRVPYDPTLPVHFVPGESLLVLSTREQTSVLNLETGERVGTTIVQRGRLQSSSLSPDGRWILLRNWDGATRAWNVRSGERAGFLLPRQPDSTMTWEPTRAGLVPKPESPVDPNVPGTSSIPPGRRADWARVTTGLTLNDRGEIVGLDDEERRALKTRLSRK